MTPSTSSPQRPPASLVGWPASTAQAHFTVAVLDERGGCTAWPASPPATRAGRGAGLAGAVEFDLDRVGVEGSAWLGSQAAAFLAAAGDDVREVQASRTAQRRRRRRRAKTDAEDAQAIARETLATLTCHPPVSSTLPTPTGTSWSPCATSGAA
jgi:transposase